ncbi:MAG: transglutaminase domain-containing protein, partial [Gemmatimonadales bacterium]
RYELTPPIEEKVADVVLGARTLDDSLKVVYDWINEDFRYVSLSLGIGGYQPRPPAEVFETKMGDCKDKATLFVAVARRMGVSADVVLLDQYANADSMLPSLAQFNHAIAAIERLGGRLFLDLTAELAPYGSLPPSSQGGFALLIHADGRGETLTLPLDPPEANRSEYRLVAQLNSEGEIAGEYHQTHEGADGYALRGAMREYQQMSAREKEQALRRMASSLFPGAAAENLQVFDSADGTIPAGVSFDVRAADATSRLGNSYVFELPMPNFASPSLIAELQREPRRYPIDIDQVIGPVSRTWVLELSLPDGWTADLPPDVQAESRFGDYRASYTLEGRTLRVVRRLSGRRGTAPRESIDELIEWLERLSEDDVDYILLSPGG